MYVFLHIYSYDQLFYRDTYYKKILTTTIHSLSPTFSHLRHLERVLGRPVEHVNHAHVELLVRVGEEEEPVDLEQVQKDIKAIDAEIETLEAEIDGYLKELGVLYDE